MCITKVNVYLHKRNLCQYLKNSGNLLMFLQDAIEWPSPKLLSGTDEHKIWLNFLRAVYLMIFLKKEKTKIGVPL